MIYLLGGHHLKDPGAPGRVFGNSEFEEMRHLRNKIKMHLTNAGAVVVMDDDKDTLSQVLAKVQSDSNDVVVEFHMNSFNTKATGTEVIIGNDADRFDRAFATRLAEIGSTIMKIPNRGVKTEEQTHRGRLGLMRERGIVALVEVCFIDNNTDMHAYRINIDQLAFEYAKAIYEFDKMIPG